ncbi:hypothetical protein Gohar_002486 [Gossypium harknessii]|uniref:Uncharacterized protein n=1 Tax=Gossypium harknessii TaxID=34285 RepID=A0A7J9HM69_9ROSI|nr:hypothetical protein [Gossypium harknessii]
MLPTILVKSSMRMLLTLPLGFLSMFSDECQPVISHKLVALTLESPLIVVAQKGSICRNFVDPDGNWEVGAMSTLIDDVGAAAIYSVADHVKASLDFNISFHSTARTQMGKVLMGHAGRSGDRGKGDCGEGEAFTGGGGD